MEPILRCTISEILYDEIGGIESGALVRCSRRYYLGETVHGVHTKKYRGRRADAALTAVSQSGKAVQRDVEKAEGKEEVSCSNSSECIYASI